MKIARFSPKGKSLVLKDRSRPSPGVAIAIGRLPEPSDELKQGLLVATNNKAWFASSFSVGEYSGNNSNDPWVVEEEVVGWAIICQEVLTPDESDEVFYSLRILAENEDEKIYGALSHLAMIKKKRKK